MTEDEAKAKWCPFVRMHVEGKAPTFTLATNREQRGKNCIGSACMAWRARTASQWVDGVGTLIDPVYDGQYPGAKEVAVVIGGFCGLAGPQ